MNKSEQQTIRTARGALLELAKDIRRSHTLDDTDWNGEEAAKREYDGLMALTRGLGRILAKNKRPKGCNSEKP